jgi:hypothetical protein
MPCLRAIAVVSRRNLSEQRKTMLLRCPVALSLSLSQRYEELKTKDDERHDDGKLLLGFTWMAPSTQEPSSLLPQQLIIIIIILLLCHHHTAAYMRASPGSSTALHPP